MMKTIKILRKWKGCNCRVRKAYGMTQESLERNEKNGVVYHREGINGDYDVFNDIEELISFIQTGNR